MQETERPKRAIIVGATSGIGLEVVNQLTAKGWQVGIAGRRHHLLIEIQRKNLNVIATECLDVTSPDAPDKLMTLIGKLGGCDLYFHSSGIGFQNPELDVTKELSTVETNALGFTRMVTAIFNYFAERKDTPAQIAVISSIAGTKGLGASPAYSASKRFVNHYLECLSQLVHIRKLKHITVTDIRPGFVRTPLLADGRKYPMQLETEAVAKEIICGIEKKKTVLTIDWRYRILCFFWRLIPRFLWIRMPIVSSK